MDLYLPRLPHLRRKYTLPARQPVASTHDCAGTGGVLGGFLQTSDVSSSLENPGICVPLLNHRDVLRGSEELLSPARARRFPAFKQSSLLPKTSRNPDLSLALYKLSPGFRCGNTGSRFLGCCWTLPEQLHYLPCQTCTTALEFF